MAQVPYSPVPDVVPTAPAAPKIGVTTPPAAFGVTIGEAEQGLGGQIEKTGEMLAQNALAIKGLQNETWAKDEFVNRSQQLGKIESEFYSKKGANAVAAQDQFATDVRGVYEDAIKNAPNPQAARFLGDALSRRISYSLVDGQRHAGEQNQQYMATVSGNRVADALSTINQHPDNDDVFNTGLATVRSEAQAQAEQSGGGTGEFNKKAEQYVSEAWVTRLKAIGFNDPETALKMLEDNQALPDKDPRKMKGVTPQGQSYVEGIREWLQRRDSIVGVAADSQHILFGDKDAGIGTVEGYKGGNVLSADSGPDYLENALTRARKLADEKHPDDPAYSENLLRKVEADYNRFHGAYRQAEYGTYANLVSAINGGTGGARITSRNDLFNNPVLYQQYESLAQSATGKVKQTQLLKMIDSNFKAGSLSPEQQGDLFAKIQGLGVLAESDPKKRDEFVDMMTNHLGDLSGQLSQGYRDRLVGELSHVQRVWEGKAEKLERTNRIAAAMTVLKPMLKDAGLDQNSTSQEVRDRYEVFTGRLYQKVTELENQTQKPLTDPVQIKGIGSQLLQETSNNWWYRNTRAFEVPEAQRAAIIKEFGARAEYNGRPPSAMEIGDIYGKILATPPGSPWRKSIGLE